MYRVSRRIASILIATTIALGAYGQTTTEMQFISAHDSRLSFMGRISRQDARSIRFTYPGVNMTARFKGRGIYLAAKSNSGYFMVKTDDNAEHKICVTQTDTIIALASNLPDGIHTVNLMYVQEGNRVKPAIYGIYLDANDNLLEAPTPPDRKIEFIGNSITCGYGIEAQSEHEPFTYATENHYYTYAAITARNLEAQEHIVARSGIGIYKNSTGRRQGTPGLTMPDKYSLTLFSDAENIDGMERWDYTLYTPDVICINLGTNDLSRGDYDKDLMRQAYVNFIKDLRKIYPKAKIVMLTGSMVMNKKSLADLQTIMDEAVAKTSDPDVYRFDMTPQDGRLGFGAGYHPSMRQQSQMANELTSYIKELMGW